MRDYIRERAVEIGNYISTTDATVRKTAHVYKVSKSTVHKDVTERLPLIDMRLAKRVKVVLEKNKAERHIRGGEATRRKYKNDK